MYSKKEYVNAFVWKRITIAVLILVFTLIIIRLIASLFLDYWWFESLGYEQVFLTNLKANAVLFAVWFSISYLILWIFLRIMHKNLKIMEMKEKKQRIEEELKKLPDTEDEKTRDLRRELFKIERRIKKLRYFLAFCSAFHPIIALSTAWFATLSWFDLLKFMDPTSFGVIEPVFGNDVSFYFFKLPFIQGMLNTSFFFFIVLVIWQSLLPLLLSLREPEIISTGFWRFSFSSLSLLLAIQFFIL